MFTSSCLASPRGHEGVGDEDHRVYCRGLSGCLFGVQVLALSPAGFSWSDAMGHVALDGTKVKANASKYKAMSYQRMKEKAAQSRRTELLRQAQAADDEEDRLRQRQAWRRVVRRS